MEGVTSLAVLPNGVYSSRRCGVDFPFVPSPITSPSAAEAAPDGEREGRLRRDEEVLDAPEELRQPVIGVGGDARCVYIVDLARQSRAMVFAWWTVYHQALLCGRWRTWRRNGRRAGLGESCFVISQDSHIDFVLSVVVFSLL